MAKAASAPQSFGPASNQVPTKLQNVQVFFDGHPGAMTAIAPKRTTCALKLEPMIEINSPGAMAPP
jgi:hypothetical protein